MRLSRPLVYLVLGLPPLAFSHWKRRLGLLAGLMFFLTVNQVSACSLDANERKDEDLFVHNEVTGDLNGDGLPDYFYLAGEEEHHLTCVYLRQKEGTKTGLKLVHETSGPYSTILDLDGNGKPELLVARRPDNNGDEEACGIDALPKATQEEAAAFYKHRAQGFEKYNFNYSMPDFYPVFNLFLQYPSRIYRFGSDRLIEVTDQMIDYWALKKKAVSQVLRSPDATSECKALYEKAITVETGESPR